MNYESFNRTLFRLRLYNKQFVFRHTLRSASKEIGISAPTLSRLMNEKLPDLITYYKCCKWLNLDMNFFFEDYED